MWCLNTSLGTTRWPFCQRPSGFTPLLATQLVSVDWPTKATVRCDSIMFGVCPDSRGMPQGRTDRTLSRRLGCAARPILAYPLQFTYEAFDPSTPDASNRGW